MGLSLQILRTYVYILLAATKKKFEKYFQSRNGLSNPLMSIFLELLRGLT